MITLNFDLVTGTVKLSAATVIKFGAAVPVRVVFSATPGVLTGIELALGDDSTAPQVLAYTEAFTAENDSTWAAILNANDNRLQAFLNGKGPTPVNAELVAIIDGNRLIAPNVQVTVQPRINNGAETSEGGPFYYTESESDARFLSGLADGPLLKRGTAAVANAAESKAVIFSTPFTGAPTTVRAWLMVPSGGALILCDVDWSTISTNGFTAVFGAATPNGNYKLGWMAIA